MFDLVRMIILMIFVIVDHVLNLVRITSNDCVIIVYVSNVSKSLNLCLNSRT